MRWMRYALLGAATAILAGGALTAAPGPLAAVQEPGQPGFETVVEHIAGSAIYIPTGRDRGLAEGDTVRVYRPAGRVRLGLMVVLGATEARASLTFLGTPFRITRGDALLIETLARGAGVAAAASDSAAAEIEAREALREALNRAAAPGIPGAARPRLPPSVHGSAAVEVDAFRATTRWGGPGIPAVERTVTTPALRIEATAAGLPLGLEANANLRASYRSAGGTLYERGGALRVYEASLARRFTGLPLEVRAGRFWSRSSSLRSFWDGGMLRVGGDGWGVGVAAGYEPARGDEGFSTDVEKWGAFADYRHRGHRLTYATDVFLTAEADRAEGWTRRLAGWAQRVRWGGLLLSSRVELEVDPPEGGNGLTRAFADLGLGLGGGLRLEGGYARDAFGWRRPSATGTLPPVMERWSVGGSWSHALASVAARGGRIREGDGRAATSIDGSLHLPRLGRGLSGGVAAAHWDGGDLGSLFVSPHLARAFGPAAVRLAYQYYGARGAEPSAFHGADAAVDFPVRGGLTARVSAQGQWGTAVSTLRSYTALRLRF